MRSFALLGLVVLSLALAGCGGTPQNTTSASPTKTATRVPGGTAILPTPTLRSGPPPGLIFASLRMFTETEGWADSEAQLFHTADGGNHWNNVTPKPPGLPAAGTLRIDSVFFLSARQAWVAFSAGAGKPELIFATSTGGTAWQQSQVQTNHISALTFVDGQSGWLLDSQGAAAGSEAVDVYRTTNGGATWAKIASATPDGKGALPFGGQKTGISFVSPTTGWITGTEPHDNFFWLYKTQDGGVTWKQQVLPLPGGVSSAQYRPNPPVFFDRQRGVLSASFTASSAAGMVFYLTQNGGQSWTASSPTPGSASLADQLDSQHLWATDGGVLYASSDGGQHWNTLINRDNFKNVSFLKFISLQVGFALRQQDGGSSVLKTTDGGQTWAFVPPVK